MLSLIHETISFVRSNDAGTIRVRILERRVPPLVQFGLYIVCGVLATATYIAVTVGLSSTVFPAMDGMTVNGAPITDALRARNLLISNCFSFLVSNLVAYVTNALVVFRTGRHHRVVEFAMFTAVNGLSFGVSQLAGPFLVQQFGISTATAMLTNVVASALLNFAFRKAFVFKR